MTGEPLCARRYLAALFACLALAACARGGKVNEPRGGLAAIDATQFLLIMQGGLDEAMRVVLNSTSAGDTFLRTKSRAVMLDDPVLAHLVARMRATLEKEEGVGIAAPQVGIDRRVILVKRVDVDPDKPVRAYVNPEIIEMSEETIVDWEGCLSIPDGFGNVARAAWIVVAAYDEDGVLGSERVEGYAARIFQHEIDHLDGILFIDRKEPGDLMPKDEYREMRSKEKAAAAEQD